MVRVDIRKQKSALNVPVWEWRPGRVSQVGIRKWSAVLRGGRHGTRSRTNCCPPNAI